MSSSLTSQFEKITLTYSHQTPAHERPDASDPDQVYKLLIEGWAPGELDFIEEIKLLLLDRSGRLMSIYPLAKGGMDTDNLPHDPKVIFAAALVSKAHQIIIARNYPGGTFHPDYLDESMIEQLAMAGQILDLPMLDYMVVTPQGYYSHMRGGSNQLAASPSAPDAGR